MPKVKTKCHICYTINKSENPPEYCKSCGADLINSEYETVQKSTVYTENYTGNSGWCGSLILTNRRLIFVMVNQIDKVVGGAMGGIINTVKNIVDTENFISARGDRLNMSLLPGTIQSVEIGESKLFKHTLLIQGKDGIQYELEVPKKEKEEWKEAIIQFNAQ